jgi:hypothetical protein
MKMTLRIKIKKPEPRYTFASHNPDTPKNIFVRTGTKDVLTGVPIMRPAGSASTGFVEGGARTFTRADGFENSMRELFLAGGEELVEQAREAWQVGAQLVMRLSQGYAPRDRMNLEKAHKLTFAGSNKDVMRYRITVGGIVEGVDVSRYAAEMHEAYYNLGPISRAKQAMGSTIRGKRVLIGRKYLERAIKDTMPDMFDYLGRVIIATYNLKEGIKPMDWFP